jgi:hypothetical protein
VQLFPENDRREHGGDDGAERVEHGRVERAPHRDAPRLQVERHARPEHALHHHHTQGSDGITSKGSTAASEEASSRSRRRTSHHLISCTYREEAAGELEERADPPGARVRLEEGDEQRGLQRGQEAHPRRQRQGLHVRLADGHLQDEPERPAGAAADEEQRARHPPAARRRRVEEGVQAAQQLRALEEGHGHGAADADGRAEYLGQAPRPPHLHLLKAVE